MSGIVQSKSGVATGTTISVTFDNPVTKGNLLIAAIFTSSQSAGVSDGANTYFIALDSEPAASYLLEMYKANAGANGSLTLTASLSEGSDTIHLHIFEVAGGYDTQEESGSNYSGANTANGTVSTGGATTQADSFVFAMFVSSFGSGITWTPGSGFTAGQTTSGGHVVFTEGREVTTTGVQTATATANFASGQIAGGIATFYASGNDSGGGDSGGGGATSSLPFLGSVTEVADVEGNDIFLGTVTVVDSVPQGAANPYLGKVRVVSAPAGRANPSLGQVVVMGSAPVNDSNPWLGSVGTS
jgi:hypothetical protein